MIILLVPDHVFGVHLLSEASFLTGLHVPLLIVLLLHFTLDAHRNRIILDSVRGYAVARTDTGLYTEQ